jgi:hypothetical protein
MTDGTLEEVLIRLRDTGPERHGWLSNHASLAVEVLVRHGQADEVHRWIDDYRDLLEDAPRGIDPIAPEQWRDPLGDPFHTGTGLVLRPAVARGALAGGAPPRDGPGCCPASRPERRTA